MAAADDHQQKKNLPPIPDGAKKEEGGGNPNERTPPLPGHPLQQQPEEFDLCKNARPTERDDEGREDNDDDDDRKYAERLAECDIRRWFFGALTATDTPLTLLHEWIVGESVDLINCAATECAHKPFVPVTEGHASEWVASVVSLISDLEMSARRDRAGDWRGGGGTDDFERVASEHSRRLPEPSDVEKARAGIPVSERANYGGEGPDKIKKMFGTRLRCASDFAPRAICQVRGTATRICASETSAEISILRRLRDFVCAPADSFGPRAAACLRNCAGNFTLLQQHDASSPTVVGNVSRLTRDWLSTLVEHYDSAAEKYFGGNTVLPRDVDEDESHRRQNFAKATAIADRALANESRLLECIRTYCDCVFRAILASSTTEASPVAWRAETIGFPFGSWSMFAELSSEDRETRAAIISRVRGAVLPLPPPTSQFGKFERPRQRQGISMDAAALLPPRRKRGRPKKTIDANAAAASPKEEKFLPKEKKRKLSSSTPVEPEVIETKPTGLSALPPPPPPLPTAEAPDPDTPSLPPPLLPPPASAAPVDPLPPSTTASAIMYEDLRVPKFCERLDIPGMRRLLATGWACDAENIDAVVGLPFRELVLDVKREVKNGKKMNRGRALLPTHGYIQTITKAIDGRTHMYGANPVLDNGWWADDYHPEKNPTGCPPWVLGAVVASSCVNGMRHVLCHVRDFRLALERNRSENLQQQKQSADARGSEPKKIAKKKKSKAGADAAPDAPAGKAPRIFTIGDALISFPATFLSAVARVVFAGAPASSSSSSSAVPKYWKDLSDPDKDAFVVDCLLRNLKGLATFGNYASKAPNLPGWLKSYIAHFGAMFAAPEPDFESISKLILGSRTLSQWYAADASPKASQAPSPASEATPAIADVAPAEIPRDVIDMVVRPKEKKNERDDAGREKEKPTRKRPKSHGAGGEDADAAQRPAKKRARKKAAAAPSPPTKQILASLTPVEFTRQCIDWAKAGEFCARSRRAFFDGGGLSYDALVFVRDTTQLIERMDGATRAMVARLSRLPAEAAKLLLVRMAEASAEIDGSTSEIRKQNVRAFAKSLSGTFRRLGPEIRSAIGKRAAKDCVLAAAAAWELP